MKIDYDKHIWEGWRVKDFIDRLEYDVENLVSNSIEFHSNITRKDIEDCCTNNQPYYKKIYSRNCRTFLSKI